MFPARAAFQMGRARREVFLREHTTSPLRAILVGPPRCRLPVLGAPLTGGNPSRRGATVFENSTACAHFDRFLGRDVCPGSTPSLEQPSYWARRTTVPRLTPSCAPEPTVYKGSLVWAQRSESLQGPT